MVEGLFSILALLTWATEWSREGHDPLCIPSNHYDQEGSSICARPVVPRLLVYQAGRVCEQHSTVCWEVRCGHACRFVLFQMILLELFSVLPPSRWNFLGCSDGRGSVLGGSRRMRSSNTYKPRTWRWPIK